MDTPRVLISEERIRQRVEELASDISNDYADADDLLLVGVLRGSFIFLADLARRLTISNRVDFIAVRSYHGSTSGAVQLIMDIRSDIAGKHVLIVEDIIDSGQTLRYLQHNLGARGPASLRTCVFVRKPIASTDGVAIDYLGLEIPDLWVVGYGLDFDDQFRTLPYIGAIEPARSPS